MPAKFPSVCEVGGTNAPVPRPRLLSPDADPSDTTVRWALDVADARPLIESIAGGATPANWVEALLTAVRVADVNQNGVQLVGPYAGPGHMIGQSIALYWPPESQPIVAELIMAAVADHPTGAARTREITSLVFADALIAVSADETGAHPDILFVSVGGTVIDDRSLWLVRASEQRYRNLIHHLPSALLQVDSRPARALFDRLRREGVTDILSHLDARPELVAESLDIVQVTDANRNAVQLFAADRADRLIGAVAYLFAASPDSARRVIAAHFHGRRNHGETMKLRTFDGRVLDVALSVTYPTPPDRLDVTLISLEDVTDRLRTEAQLRQLQADYSRAARIATLGELASSIAHEVNQPLSAIAMNAETSLRWLSRDEPNLDKVSALTARIAESARHASGIVQRIRGMAARHVPERVPMDLNEVVDEALHFVRHDLDARSITLSAGLGAGLPPVLGDRVQLQQVIVNLLVNAVQALVQAGTHKGRIALASERDAGGAVVFSIHDNGPGIAPENLDRVFEGFFTTKDDGMGIGLSVCQSIILAHGGRISAANHPDGGALFRCSLPGGPALAHD